MEHNEIPTGFEILPTGAALANVVTQTLLRNSLPDLNDNSKRFIPYSALRDLLRPQQVKQLVELFLPGIDRTKLDALVHFVCPEESQCNRCTQISCTGGRILFSTLIWIARPDLIPKLLEIPRLCDNQLASTSNSGRLDSKTDWRSNLLQMIDKPVEAQLFDQVQLQLRAPFLRPIEPHNTEAFTFEDAVTLPWTDYRSVHEPAPGNPCEVGEVHIHPAHHALVSPALLRL